MQAINDGINKQDNLSLLPQTDKVTNICEHRVIRMDCNKYEYEGGNLYINRYLFHATGADYLKQMWQEVFIVTGIYCNRRLLQQTDKQLLR